MLRILCTVVTMALGGALLTGCVPYEPLPAYYPPPTTFDRAWNAALGGVQDAGIKIISAEPTTGLIRGAKDGIDVTVSVLRLADGRVRVQFDSKGSMERDPELANRFSQAYDRRMGR